MTPEETIGKLAIAKKNINSAHNVIDKLWELWINRSPTNLSSIKTMTTLMPGELGTVPPSKLIEIIIENLNLALCDINKIRQSMEQQ